MNHRPGPETNGSNGSNGTNGKGPTNGKYRQIPELRDRQPIPRTSRPRRLWIGLVSLIILAVAIGALIFRPDLSSNGSQAQAFRLGVNRAMSAAELTQSAASQEEWRTVATWWQESIDLMSTVPLTSSKHSIAQQKIQEYQQNLQYAQEKLLEFSSKSATASPLKRVTNLWGIGSQRVEVVKLQGEPRQTDRYDSLCKEVLYYGKSLVELSNGLVVKFEDFDKNLKVTKGNVLAVPDSGSSWTLGSPRETVFQVQGTPSRVVGTDYSRQETLFYGNSSIEMLDDRVSGYNNLDQNLKISLQSAIAGAIGSTPYWSLESLREDVFRVQGVPTQVTLDNAACTEVLRYGNSTVQLSNGFIKNYDNFDGNLKVRVQ